MLSIASTVRSSAKTSTTGTPRVARVFCRAGFVPFFRTKSSTKRLFNHLGCRIVSRRIADNVAKLPAPLRSLYESIA